MTSLIQKLFLLCLAAFAVSLFFIHRLPPRTHILKQLARDPAQTETREPAFSVTQKGITYTIRPLFAYELYGLVATQHSSRSWLDISHDKWQDYLNIKDISTIWGRNVMIDDYRKVSFSHGDWTGYYTYGPGITFDGRYFANSHLLTDDPRLAKKIMRTRIGDQIYLRGYLVEYSHSNRQFVRSSSTIREDTGNGACEVIWLTDYKIIKAANREWRLVHRFSMFLGVLCLAFLSVSFFITPVRK